MALLHIVGRGYRTLPEWCPPRPHCEHWAQSQHPNYLSQTPDVGKEIPATRPRFTAWGANRPHSTPHPNPNPTNPPAHQPAPPPESTPTSPRSPPRLDASQRRDGLPSPPRHRSGHPSPPSHPSGDPSHRSGLPNHRATRSRRDRARRGDVAPHGRMAAASTTPPRIDARPGQGRHRSHGPPCPGSPPSYLDRVALVTPPLLEGSGFSPSRLRSAAMLDRRLMAEADVDLGPDLDLNVRTAPATRTRTGDTGGLVHEHRQQPPATRVQARSTQSRSRRAVDATPGPIDRAVRLLAGGAQQKHGQSLHHHLPPSVTRPSRYRQAPTKSGGRERGLLRRPRRAITSARI